MLIKIIHISKYLLMQISDTKTGRTTINTMKTSSLVTYDIYICIVIFIISLIYYLTYASYGYSESDWGGIVVAAKLFLNGDIFYKDFSIVYTPGIYLYTALAFKIFGIKLWSALAAWTFIRAINCSLFYLLGRKFFQHKVAVILSLILWIIPGPIHKSFLIFLGLLHLIIFLKLINSNNKVLYLFSGLIAGVSFIFRFDLLLSFVITLLLIESMKLIKPIESKSFKLQIMTSIKNFLIFCVGTLSSILLFVLYLVYNSVLSEAINQTLSFLGRERSGMFSLPPLSKITSWGIWDFSHYAVVFVPLGISLLLLIEIIRNIKVKRFGDIDRQLLVLFVYGLLSLHQVLRWPWVGRLFQILPPFIIADIYLILTHYFNHDRFIKKPHLIYTIFMIAINLVLFSLIIGSLTMSDMYTNNSILIRLTNKTLLSVPKVSVYTTKKKAEEVHKVIDIIETETSKDDYIYIVQYYPMYYFITDRKNATRYYFLEAYVYSEEKQLEVIKELEDKNVKLVISGPNHPETPEATILNAYLSKNFEIIERVGEKIIYKKRG